jgi:hypothetical protein
MINFHLDSFVHHRTHLIRALKEAESACKVDRNAHVPEARAGQLSEWITGGIRYCVDAINIKEAELTKTDLEVMIGNRLHTQINWGDLFESLKRLCEEINVGIGRECFFHYKRDRAILLFRTEQEWDKIIKAFPSTKQEILFGVDAYAFENNSACVFHMSRVAEIGLRALAKERGLKVIRKHIPIEWGTWGDILKALDEKVVDITKQSNGPQKDKAFEFYKTVLSDLRAIQGLRDRTMHFRDNYDQGETQSAMFRTKSLMTMLASKLSESSNREIPWRAWK